MHWFNDVETFFSSIALHAAKDWVYQEIDKIGSNYGTADNRLNASFMFDTSDFTSEMNQG